MKTETYDVVIVGAGCAGLAAGIALRKKGIERVVILEKDDEPGGILNQCIHNGFGLTTFHEQLSGPSFAERFEKEAKECDVEIRTGAMVISIEKDRRVLYESAKDGFAVIQAGAIIMAVGCYERNRGAIAIPGTRPAGVYTAGQAQRYLNIDGWMVGKKVFILGSGDIGLIMARRMTLEGAEVLGVAEIMPYSNGLPRNMKQCLEDFDIPLYLSHTVTRIYGRGRLSGIDIARVDENRKPIVTTTKHIECDTLLLSIGLIPENHLLEKCGIPMDPSFRGPQVDESYMCRSEGIFACGNGLHVHDLADYAAHQGTEAGEACAEYLRNGKNTSPLIHTVSGNNIGYVVPSFLHTSSYRKVAECYFRVRKPMKNAEIRILSGDQIIRSIHRDQLIPSEMEHVFLPYSVLGKLKSDLVFEVREEETQ